LTLTYTVSNACENNISKKVYLNVLRNGKIPSLKDTVTICYEQAEALNINQIFGIEVGGKLSYDKNKYDDRYITTSTSATYNGAVIMNGKKLYDDGETEIEFVYNTGSDSCVGSKTFTFVIKLVAN
jgi:hypothetical protein